MRRVGESGIFSEWKIQQEYTLNVVCYWSRMVSVASFFVWVKHVQIKVCFSKLSIETVCLSLTVKAAGVCLFVCFFLFIHTSIFVWDLWNELCLSGRLADHLAWQTLKCWTLQNVLLYFSDLPCLLYRHHWLLPFYTAFTDLDLQGATRSAQSKTYWLHFLPLFI